MCLDCIRSVFCDHITISEDEKNATRTMTPTTQLFLVKRKRIISYLLCIITIQAVSYCILIPVALIFTNLIFIDENWVIAELALIFSLITSLAEYYLIRKWYNAWNDYKTSIYYSKIIAIIVYLASPIIIMISTMGNTEGNIESTFMITVGTLFVEISIIHTFILKSNTLVKEISDSYEYKIISASYKVIYIPLATIVMIVICVFTEDLLIISFAICYIGLITISSIINNSINEKLENVFLAGCLITLVIMTIKDPTSLANQIIGLYVWYIITSVVIVDLANDLIVKLRMNTNEMNGGLGNITRDTGLDNSDATQLLENNNTSTV